MTDKESKVYKEMKEMAANRFDEFLELAGVDLTKFVVCSKKKEGKTLSQIATIAKVTKSKAQRICKVCP